MTADIKDVCPDCGSADVVDTYGSTTARYQRPQYACHNCGTRFNNPQQYDTVTEEYV